MEIVGLFMVALGLGFFLGFVAGVREEDQRWRDRLHRMAEELRRMGER
jgi:hypothetical protein